jgi:hypothetical protein
MTRKMLLGLVEARLSHWMEEQAGEAVVAEMRDAVVEGDVERVSRVISDDGVWRVSLLALGRGAELPIHDHPATRGVLLIHEGALRVRHFDVIDGRRGKRTVMLVNRGERLVTTGDFDWFGARRNNLHALESVADFTLVFSVRQYLSSLNFPRSMYALIRKPYPGETTGVAVVKTVQTLPPVR